MREVLGLMERGDAQAREAIDLWSWRARHYLGGYLAQLGGLDAIAFTGGIGENSAFLRSEVCRGLEQLGITVDSQLNRDGIEGERKISTPGGLVEAWVIPTDEELHIARQSVSLLAAH